MVLIFYVREKQSIKVLLLSQSIMSSKILNFERKTFAINNRVLRIDKVNFGQLITQYRSPVNESHCFHWTQVSQFHKPANQLGQTT